MFNQILKISLENVLTSTGGKILIAALVILCFLVIVKISKAPKENNAKTMAVCGLLLATAIVLGELRLFKMPLGGSVTPASMLPVILAGYFYGSVHLPEYSSCYLGELPSLIRFRWCSIMLPRRES